MNFTLLKSNISNRIYENVLLNRLLNQKIKLLQNEFKHIQIINTEVFQIRNTLSGQISPGTLDFRQFFECYSIWLEKYLTKSPWTSECKEYI